MLRRTTLARSPYVSGWEMIRLSSFQCYGGCGNFLFTWALGDSAAASAAAFHRGPACAGSRVGAGSASHSVEHLNFPGRSRGCLVSLGSRSQALQPTATPLAYVSLRWSR